MLTDWRIGQKTDINPDGVETSVVMAFTSLDGSHAAYSMSPGAARAMADELAGMAEDIEPQPPRRRRRWVELVPGFFLGYSVLGVMWAVADLDWWRVGIYGVCGAAWFWIWSRRENR